MPDKIIFLFAFCLLVPLWGEESEKGVDLKTLFSDQEIDYIQGKKAISPFVSSMQFKSSERTKSQRTKSGGEILDVGILGVQNVKCLEAILAKGFSLSVLFSNQKAPVSLVGYDRVEKVFFALSLEKNIEKSAEEKISFSSLSKAVWAGWGNFSEKRPYRYKASVRPKKCSKGLSYWHGPYFVNAVSKFNAQLAAKRKVKGQHFQDNIGPGTLVRLQELRLEKE